MRRSLSLILAILMVLSSLTVMSFTVSAETIELQGTRYGTGMENHTMAPDNEVGNPSGTVFMYGVVLDETKGVTADTCNYMMTNSDNFEFKFTISKNKDMTDSVTKIWTPTNCEGFGKGFANGGSYIIRFTPCLEAGENEWIPENGAVYYINLEVKDLTTETIYSLTGHENGYSLNDDPITKTTPVVIVEPTTTVEFAVGAHFGLIENYGGRTVMLPGYGALTTAQKKLVTDNLKSGVYKLKVTVTDETTGDIYIIPEYKGFDWGEAIYGDWLLRIEVCNYGIIPDATHVYSVDLEISKEGKVLFAGESADGAFKANQAVTDNGAIVPDSIPYTHLTGNVGFAGYQTGDSALRLIGYTDFTKYDSVAFDITVTGDAKKATTLSTTTVFTSLKSGSAVTAATVESGIEAPVKVAHDYLYGYAIENITDGEYTFTIVPTATVGAEVIEGETVVLNVTVANGVVTVA